jgi:hypothetical protein
MAERRPPAKATKKPAKAAARKTAPKRTETLRSQADRIGDAGQKQVRSVTETLEDLVTAATFLGDNTASLEETLVDSMKNEHSHDRRIIKALAAAVVVLFLAVAFQNIRSIFYSGPILARLDHQTQGVDTLVEFVNSVKASTCDPAHAPKGGCPPSESEVLLQHFIQIECASSDPGQRQVCVQLGYRPK